MVEGDLYPDAWGLASHEGFAREVLVNVERDTAALPGIRRYVALRNGVIAGGASWRRAGASPSSLERRRCHHGIQTAPLSARLADAAARWL